MKDELQSCSRIQNPTERLACYDGLAKAPPLETNEQAQGNTGQSATSKPKTASERRAAAREAKAAEKSAAAAPAAVGTVPSTPVTASEQRAANERRRAEERSERSRDGYEAVVLRAWESATGEYYVALTNGEIWRSEAHDKPRIKDREEVVIQPGAVGSWFMQFKTQKRPAIRVSLLK